LNPAYQKHENAPLWGLAKPLPRVVRPGMKRGATDEQGVVEDKGAERHEPGSSEVIPQIGMIGDQRQDAGKDAVGERRDVEDRGYGHDAGRRQSQHTAPVQRIGSENSVLDRYGTPKDERSNPMEEWRSRGPSYRRSHGDPFDDQNADLGDRRLSSVQEVPSSLSTVSTIGDVNEIDLEAGEYTGDWPLEKEDAAQYSQDAADEHNLWCSIRAKFREPLAECLAVSHSFAVIYLTN
jgi:aquaglyceroporin related protein